MINNKMLPTGDSSSSLKDFFLGPSLRSLALLATGAVLAAGSFFTFGNREKPSESDKSGIDKSGQVAPFSDLKLPNITITDLPPIEQKTAVAAIVMGNEAKPSYYEMQPQPENIFSSLEVPSKKWWLEPPQVNFDLDSPKFSVGVLNGISTSYFTIPIDSAIKWGDYELNTKSIFIVDPNPDSRRVGFVFKNNLLQGTILAESGEFFSNLQFEGVPITVIFEKSLDTKLFSVFSDLESSQKEDFALAFVDKFQLNNGNLSVQLSAIKNSNDPGKVTAFGNYQGFFARGILDAKAGYTFSDGTQSLAFQIEWHSGPIRNEQSRNKWIQSLK